MSIYVGAQIWSIPRPRGAWLSVVLSQTSYVSPHETLGLEHWSLRSMLVHVFYVYLGLCLGLCLCMFYVYVCVIASTFRDA